MFVNGTTTFPIYMDPIYGHWKIGRKEKNLESNFLFTVWFKESQKDKKKLREKMHEKLVL